jgi:hypothetical protein
MSDSAQSFESLCLKSREAMLAITDTIVETLQTQPSASTKVYRLLNRLAWHLGFWKSYGTSDTAKRAQAGLNLIGTMTIFVSDGSLGATKTMWLHTLQSISGMALVPDRKKFSPMMIRELYAQIGADLQAFKVEFGGKATRE